MRAKPCYSLRYDKHQSNPTQSQQCGHILQLWKSCVLPHYLLYLRYLCSEDQIQQLQVSLNQSLSSNLRVGGHAQALLADTGVPPTTKYLFHLLLHITQRLQLAQMRYRVSHSPTGSLPLFWWKVWNETGIPLTDNFLHGRMIRAIGHIDRDKIDPSLCAVRARHIQGLDGQRPMHILRSRHIFHRQRHCLH